MTQKNKRVQNRLNAEEEMHGQSTKNVQSDLNGQSRENTDFAGDVQQERIQTAGNAEATVGDVKKGSHAELWRAIKFTLFSISAGVIEIILYSILDLVTPWPYWPCYLIALVASVLWNFTLNRQYTFQSANNVPVAMLKVAAFYAVFTPVTTVAGNYLAETAHWPGILVTLLNMLCNFVLEYLYDRYFVFGKSIDTNERAKKAADDSETHVSNK